MPKDHILRRIRGVLRLEVVEGATRNGYDPKTGRPPVDPTIAFRMILLGYLSNLSENRLCQDMAMHAGYRWFCGLDFNDTVPDRTTLVKLRRQRWGETIFRSTMRAVVEQCIEAGLVKGGSLVVDGIAVDARAAITSVDPIAPVVDLESYMDTQWVDDGMTKEEDHPPPPPSQGSGSLRDGHFRGKSFSNETHRSRADRDARLFRKGRNEGAMLRYIVHDLMDCSSSVILETAATHAYIALERKASLGLIDQLHDDHPRLSSRYLLADRNYRQGASLAEVEKRGLKP